mmetsp:Transcript_8061/g.14022  ORF Transcript_8061/g.14022 Transcript_8061/m.14022 type:complete len:121 (+) Transcript_8061:180-542(+)
MLELDCARPSSRCLLLHKWCVARTACLRVMQRKQSLMIPSSTVRGLEPDGGRGSVNVDDKLKELMRAYVVAWAAKKFDTSDKLRDELQAFGVEPKALNARFRKQIGAPARGPFKIEDYVK